MFPTQHDITPENLDVTGKALRQMLMAGNEVLVVSKPHLSVIETLCRDLAGCKELILFRFTIGSMDDDTLALWEPGAPKFAERFASLQHAHDAGYFTSVSMEPLLETDEDAVVALVEKLQPFITDSIWIGKMNQVRARLSVNGFGKDETIQEAADAIIASQTDARIRSLYARMEGWDKLRWKESIKKVVGLEIPTEAGLDV